MRQESKSTQVQEVLDISINHMHEIQVARLHESDTDTDIIGLRTWNSFHFMIMLNHLILYICIDPFSQ